MNSRSNFRLTLALGAGALCCSGAAHAQTSLPRVGVDIGYSYLLDSKSRATFGSGVTDLGVGVGNVNPSVEGKVGLDFSILRPRETTNGVKSDALVISAGPEYRKVLLSGVGAQGPQQEYPPGVIPPGSEIPGGSGLPSVLPYYGASVNLIYAQVDAPFAGVDGKGVGVGGSLFAGVSFNDRFYLEGRARATSKIKEFSFSRVGVTAGVRF